MLDTAFSRIEKVYFIDEKKLFVSYKTTGDNNTLRKVDIWYNQGNTQLLQDSDLIINTTDLSEIKDTIFVKNRTFPELTYSSNIHFFNDKAYIVFQTFCPITLRKPFSMLSSKCESYIENNIKHFGLMSFKFTSL